MDILVKARGLRSAPTEAEKKLWHAINRGQLGVKFRRQYPIGSYIVDFACLPRHLVIEADGGQHGKESDATRTATLENLGYHVIRFWNNDILQNIDGVLQIITDQLKLAS